MKIIHLVQKDILLLYKQIGLVMVVTFFFPIFMYENTGEGSELLLFLILILFSQYTLFNSLSILDNKYETEKMFLILPYKRKELVVSRYVLLLVVYLLLLLVTILSSALSPLNYLSVNGYLIILFASTIFFGLLIPIQYKFGYDKTKYISFSLIFVMPFLSGYISKFLVNTDLIKKWANLKPEVIFVVLFGIIILMNGLSIYCSNKIFYRKDL